MKCDSRITICAAAALLFCGAVTTAGTYDLSWYTIDGGGGTSLGGLFELSGTVGQPDASVPMTGGTYELTGGFWQPIESTVEPPCGDFDNDGDVDIVDFNVFTQCFGGAANPPAATCPPGVDADCDDDGDVDALDFVVFGQNFTGSL